MFDEKKKEDSEGGATVHKGLLSCLETKMMVRQISKFVYTDDS